MHIRFIRALMFLLVVLSMSAASLAQIGVAISIGPPPLPVYEQPLCPGDGYLWTPGYWAYDNDVSDYYWVPGTWVMAPEIGFLWTPAYWGWGGDGFVFYDGYWGPHIGFYGGINYGYGYFGTGFQGGRWDNGHFFYNRSVSNVNITNIHNVYNTTVINNNVSRVSFNGGNGGIRRVRHLKKRLQRGIDTCPHSRFRRNMRRRPGPTRSNARPRTWAGPGSQRHRGRETSMTAALYRPKRQEDLMLQLVGEDRNPDRRKRALPSIPTTFRLWPRLLRIRAIRSWTESTSSSSKSKSRSSKGSGINSSSSRTRST